MTRLRLILACDHHDLLWPMKNGTITPEGIDLQILTVGADRHERMMRNGEFDACEIGLSHYLMAHLKGMPFEAIPVFILRMFPHRFIYCRGAEGLYSLDDLRGKQVGVVRPSNMLGLWLRGLMRQDFGIGPDQVTWVAEKEDVVESPLQAKFRYRTLSTPKNLKESLLRGEIDAVVAPGVVEPFHVGVGGVRRLFPDFKKEELAYYEKTKIFSIMHLIVIKENVLRNNPWVGVNLLEAFRIAKRWLDEYLKGTPRSGLAWASALWEEERAVLGEDPWAYNVRDNLNTIQRIIQYAFEDGLIPTKPDVGDLFAENVLDV